MTSELDTILIAQGQSDFERKLQSLLDKICDVAFLCSRVSVELCAQVTEIADNVQQQGDNAIIQYTKQFDGVKLLPSDFLISQAELVKAHRQVDENLLLSIRGAIENVRKYQKEIFVGGMKHPGIKYTPIKRVGICVPGASAPLPSTVIMCAVPAQVAGVEEIAVVSPPRYEGSIQPVILATCYELGIKEVYRVGGAQAVAALAFGTETVPKVDKIVGPGNVWVQTAKKIVFGAVGIDSCAGQSEVLIIASDRANPSWAAADMLSQAEHAPGSALLFTDSQKLAEAVLEQLKEQVRNLERSEETMECLLKFSGIVVFKNMDEAIEQANLFAPEHLEIQCGNKSREIADRITNAGAIFIGDYTPVAVGDYWAGPSHTLPTGQTAKFFSPLSANDFVKSTSIIEYDRKKLAQSADDIVRLAEAEGLDAHARSVKIRMQ
jgi:histidinol dehydrogenase